MSDWTGRRHELFVCQFSHLSRHLQHAGGSMISDQSESSTSAAASVRETRNKFCPTSLAPLPGRQQSGVVRAVASSGTHEMGGQRSVHLKSRGPQRSAKTQGASTATTAWQRPPRRRPARAGKVRQETDTFGAEPDATRKEAIAYMTRRPSDGRGLGTDPRPPCAFKMSMFNVFCNSH